MAAAGSPPPSAPKAELALPACHRWLGASDCQGLQWAQAIRICIKKGPLQVTGLHGWVLASFFGRLRAALSLNGYPF